MIEPTSMLDLGEALSFASGALYVVLAAWVILRFRAIWRVDTGTAAVLGRGIAVHMLGSAAGIVFWRVLYRGASIADQAAFADTLSTAGPFLDFTFTGLMIAGAWSHLRATERPGRLHATRLALLALALAALSAGGVWAAWSLASVSLVDRLA